MITLCALGDLDDPDTKSFVIPALEHARPLRIIATRLGDEVFAWVNACPHAGVPLDDEPGRLLDASGQFLVCFRHGAMFTRGSGMCLRGPCRGRRLLPISVRIEDGFVKIDA